MHMHPESRLTMTDPADPKDWPEDFSHENGDYLNRCCHCNDIFRGHKRRVCCKLCSSPPDAERRPLTQEERDAINAVFERMKVVAHGRLVS